MVVSVLLVRKLLFFLNKYLIHQLHFVWPVNSFKWILVIFFHLGFLSRLFTNHRAAVEREGYLFNSSLTLPPASLTLRHHPGNYCWELTSAHSYQTLLEPGTVCFWLQVVNHSLRVSVTLFRYQKSFRIGQKI